MIELMTKYHNNDSDPDFDVCSHTECLNNYDFHKLSYLQS